MEVSEASNDSLASFLFVFGVHTGVSFEWFGSVGDVTTDGFRGPSSIFTQRLVYGLTPNSMR